MKQAFAAAMVRHRWLVIAVVVLLTAVAGYSATKIRFNNDLEIWFMENDPELVQYRAFLDRFEADRIVVVGVFSEDIFNPQTLSAIDRITRKAEDLEDVHRVRSLTNARVFKGEEGTVLIAPLVKRLPRTAAESKAIRDWALSNPLLRGLLVSEDGKGAAVVLELERDVKQGPRMTRLVERVRELVRKEGQGRLRLAIAGTPVFSVAFGQANLKDMSWLTPLTIGLVFLVIYLFFRRVTAALLPLLVVIASIAWTLGVMGALGVPLTTVSSPLNGLIVAVGVADAIHVIAEYYRRRAAGNDHVPAVEGSISHLLVPCLITSATTMLGLLSLVVSKLRPIQEFAVFSSFGVLCAFLLSITFLPALLAVVPPPPRRVAARQGGSLTVRLLDLLGRPTRRRATWCVAVSIVLLGLAVWGITRVEVGPIGIGAFDKEHPARVDSELIDRQLGGADSLEVLVTAPRQGLKDPALLRRIDAFERWVERFPTVSSARSIADSLKELNRVLHEGTDSYYRLPDSREAVAQYYMLFEGEDDFRKLVQKTYGLGRISVRVRRPETATENARMLREVEARANAIAKAGIAVHATGSFKLQTRAMEYMIESMIESFLLAFAVTSVVLVLMFRSLRLGLFAMIPNVLPIVVGLGAMAAMGISLNPGTLMIGSIAIGLVVDDTVHFMFRFRAHARAGDSVEQAIHAAMHEAGRPIVATSATLVAGFIVWVLASFVPAQNYGEVSSLIIVLALLGDLVLLPAMLLLARPRIVHVGDHSTAKEE